MMISPKKSIMSCENVGGKCLKSSSNTSVEKNIFNWQVVVYSLKKYANLQSVFSSKFLKMKNCRTSRLGEISPKDSPRFLPLSEVREGSTSLGTMTPQKRTDAHHNKVNQGESPLIVVVLQKLEAIPQ